MRPSSGMVINWKMSRRPPPENLSFMLILLNILPGLHIHPYPSLWLCLRGPNTPCWLLTLRSTYGVHRLITTTCVQWPNWGVKKFVSCRLMYTKSPSPMATADHTRQSRYNSHSHTSPSSDPNNAQCGQAAWTTSCLITQLTLDQTALIQSLRATLRSWMERSFSSFRYPRKRGGTDRIQPGHKVSRIAMHHWH